jgi:hypothetical protein
VAACWAVGHRHRYREVDTKHIDADYGFGLLANLEKITESPESPELLAIPSATGVARHLSGRRPRGLREIPPLLSLSLPGPLILPHAM